MQKIAEKLVKIMEECRYIAKNGVNSFHNYKYATSSDVLDRINRSLVKQNICSVAVPELISLTDVKTAKGNTEHLATVKMNITLIDTASGESLNITGLGSGQDSGDKAVMKAQTAAIKYAYMLSMATSTGDDPEADMETDKSSCESESVNGEDEEERKIGNYCSLCGLPVTAGIKTVSLRKYGKILCMKCQKKQSSVA